MKKQQGFTLMEFVIVLIAVFGVGGWIANIVKLVSMTLDPITALVIVRAIGIFVPPLGAVLGYL